MNIQIKHGDCLEKLKELPDNSVDSIVTDPPYGLGFMNKEWDDPNKLKKNLEHHKNKVKQRGQASFSPLPFERYGGRKEGVWFQEWCEEWGKECFRILKPGGYLLSFSAPRMYHRMTSGLEDAGFQIRDQIMWVFGQGFPKSQNMGNGIGTALKPAHEPICVCRKPFNGTCKNNIKEWGTGGLNIDDCRIELEEGEDISIVREEIKELDTKGQGWGFKSVSRGNEGRWPANIIFDETIDEVWKKYFYCPKVSSKDREEGNNHPTVKPTDLMLYLIKLVTPKDGTVLDPFMGSGSTGKACVRGEFGFIGIEKELEYIEISVSRIDNETKKLIETNGQEN